MKTLEMVLDIIAMLVVIFCIYFCLKEILKKENKAKNKNKIKIRLKKLKVKIFKLNYIKRMQKLLNDIEDLKSFKFKFLNSISLFIISVFIAIIAFIYLFKKYNLFIFSALNSVIFIILPIILLEIINLKFKNNLKSSFSLYIISLQSFAKSSNDVIMALNNTKALKPLDRYINEFLKLVNIGFNINKAFEELIRKINSKEVAKFFYLLNLCYINGGNLNEVISKYNSYYTNVEKIKKIQSEKRNSYILTMIFILILNIFLVFFVVLGNESYKSIILASIIGKVIIDINSLVYILISILVIKIIRMEE